jgi:hypothetical protein
VAGGEWQVDELSILKSCHLPLATINATCHLS